MSLTTDFNVSPYYDDFTETDDYYRVLFRPGFGVQARELTQLQTLLQYQLQRIGLHSFENGSKVFGGDVTLDTNIKSIKLETQFSGSSVNVSAFENKLVIGSTSKAQGQVIKAEEATATDQPTLMLELLTANSFADGETVTTIESGASSANTISTGGVSGLANAQSNGSIVSISNGAFFVDGFFVRNGSETIILDKYSSTPTKKIGLSITETLIDSSSDTDLLDNAQGTTNYAAPGANRLKIALTLTAKNLTATTELDKSADQDFIELLRVENGQKTKEVKYPLYGEIEKTLARRTFDESGDYTVRPFGLQLVESISGNTDAISAGLEPGKAYVKGYEFETIGTTFLDIDKARTTANVSSFTMSSGFGNKLFVKKLKGAFEFHKHEIIDLHCVNSASVNAQTDTANALTKYNSTKVGTARVRQTDFQQTDVDTANTTNFHSTYALSLYDVRVDKTITGEVDSGDGLNDTVINLPPATTSIVNGAYTGTTLVVNTTFQSNTTSDTIKITDYQVTGGEHKATANTKLSQNVRSNSTFTLSFDLSAVDSVIIPHGQEDQSTAANTRNVFLTTLADVDELSKYNLDPNGNTILSDTGRNTMLFPYPYSPINGLPGGVSYRYKRFDQQTSNSIGGISFTSTTAGGSFRPSVKTLSASEAMTNYVVTVKSATGITDGTNSSIGITNGMVLSFQAGTGRSIEVTGSGETVVLHCNTSGAITTEIVSTVQVTNATPRTKSLIVGNTTVIGSAGTTNVNAGQVFITTPNKTTGQRDNLMISDVFNLTKVVDSGNAAAFPVLADIQNSAKDITSRYELDNGQRDNLYDHASIILKPGQTPPTGRILVIVDYFDPDTNPGYFAVNSYTTDMTANTGYNFLSNGTAQNNFSYSTIPTYTSPLTGERFKLSDTLDFRPVRANANNASGANTTNDITTNTTSLDISTSADGGTPDDDGTFTQDIQYYLGRNDKIVLTRDREFSVLKGVPALDPVTPADDDDSMTMYTLKVPAYTFSISDIQTEYIDNRRFTMRDIGKLEKRIENLEYYTSLSLLEKETAARDVTGSGQTDSLFNPQGSRFKNGILVDAFKGHGVGDVSDESYLASIDFEKQELRPRFFSDNYKFFFNSSNSSAVTASGNVVTLPFSSNNFVIQPQSSNSFITVNPFNFVSFIGSLELDPNSDTWFDTVTRPDVLVDIEGVNDAWKFGVNRNGHGSQWSDWVKIWSGEQVNPDPAISTRALGNGDNRRQAKLSSQIFTRTGIKTANMPQSITKVIGNKVVDASVVPFVRSQTINFKARGLKPSENVFAFFDNTAVNTTPASVLTLTAIADTSTHFQEGEIVSQGANTAEVLFVSRTTASNTATMHIRVISSSGVNTSSFTTGTLTGATSNVSATISSRVTPTNTTQANTNLAGEVAGSVLIPSGTFRTGERLLRICDSATNNVAATTTVAEKRYSVAGILSTRESSIVSTRLPISRRDEVTNETVYFDQNRRDSTEQKFLNPLSQTFFVDKTQNPNGIFVESVDLFFRDKATSNTTTVGIPVTVQLRPIRNNLPSTNLIIPFGEKTLRPEEINAQSANVPLSSNSSHITTFSFDSPVYLPPDEYALTIVTNSSEYQLWTAIEGEVVTDTSRRVTKQPNVGVLYEAQNQTVPIADPERFLTFRVNRCEFHSNTGSAVFSSNAVSLSANSANVFADVIKVNTQTLEFSNTSLDYTFRKTNTSGVTDTTYSNLPVDQEVYLDSRIMLQADTASEVYVKATMSTNDTKVSPVIDVDRLNLITVENDIGNGELSNSDFLIINAGANYNTSVTATVSGGGTDNVATITLANNSDGEITGVTVTSGGSGYISTPTVTIVGSATANGTGASIIVNGETDNRGGPINAKYITRKVTLEDGFDASDLKIIFNAYKPRTASIHCYGKVLNADDPDTLDDKNYFLLDQETPSTVFSLNDDDLKEYIYKTTNDAVSYTVGNVTFNKFKTFAVKIVMLSTDKSDPPRIKDLRVIALDE